jgi:antitoxin ParD1/3/4
MAKVETISVALPPEMATALREAVAGGAYASSSEIVNEALRDWHQQRHERRVQTARIRDEIDRAARNPVRLTDVEVGAHFDNLLSSTLAKKAS